MIERYSCPQKHSFAFHGENSVIMKFTLLDLHKNYRVLEYIVKHERYFNMDGLMSGFNLGREKV